MELCYYCLVNVWSFSKYSYFTFIRIILLIFIDLYSFTFRVLKVISLYNIYVNELYSLGERTPKERDGITSS